jgi:hypothetical protein
MPIDRLAEGGEQLGRLAAVGRSENDRLAAAQRQPRHRILVAHSARQPKRVRQRFGRILIMPEARSAGGGAEVGRMDGDDRSKPVLGLVDEMQNLMRVEVGVTPGRFHLLSGFPFLIEA